MPVNSSQCILVTGATRGIGKAIALRMARTGATIGVHGRNMARAREVCAEIRSAVPLCCDLDKPENAPGLVDEFVEKAGNIDGLVNNAGMGKASAFRSITLEKWRKTFRVNLEAAMLASRQAYSIMRRNSQGSIVNIASLAAHGPGKWMGPDYAAAKAGLVSMTRSLAYEAGRFNIRVNAVSPGFVETDMTKNIPDKNRRAIGIPMERFGSPEEIASVVVFLMSQDAGYITGQTLHVDGGLW
ncbi:MAG: SDR family NAD(P)-dependent oxidoreductase [Verrucomicrobiota bacterium]